MARASKDYKVDEKEVEEVSSSDMGLEMDDISLENNEENVKQRIEAINKSISDLNAALKKEITKIDEFKPSLFSTFADLAKKITKTLTPLITNYHQKITSLHESDKIDIVSKNKELNQTLELFSVTLVAKNNKQFSDTMLKLTNTIQLKDQNKLSY